MEAIWSLRTKSRLVAPSPDEGVAEGSTGGTLPLPAFVAPRLPRIARQWAPKPAGV